MAKLLVIGFDGMDYFMAKKTIVMYPFKILKPILKQQLVKEAVTGPSWASFYTGLHKDIHGITDGWGRDIDGSNSFEDIRKYAFWNILREAGHKVYTDNLPITRSGFPFTSSIQKDLVNWVCNPLQDGMGNWRSGIREMGSEMVLSKTRLHSFNLVNSEKLRSQDLVFIQFSFLDRLGHTFTFKSSRLIKKSYFLAYELIEKLFEITMPQYLIVTSDHGFCHNSTHHLVANSAALILSAESYSFFVKNRVFKRFSCSNIFRWKFGKVLLGNRSFALALLEAPRYIVHFNYIRQVDIFDVILKMFKVDYQKPKRKIRKPIKTEIQEDHEFGLIEERLKRLGYL